jgi:hypothetical protein
MNLFQKDLDNTGYTVEEVMRYMPQNMSEGGQLVSPSVDGSRPGYNGEELRTYLNNLPEDAEVNVKKLSKKFKVSRSTVSTNRTNLRPDLKVAFNLPKTKGKGKLTEGILQAYKDLGKGKNTTSVDIYNKIKDLDVFKDYNRRDLLTTIGKRLRTNNKPYKKTTPATSDAFEETKQAKRKIYLDQSVKQPTIVYKATKAGGPSEIINIKFPETGNNTKANFKKVIDNYYSLPKDDAKIKVAKNKIIKDFFPDGLSDNQWNKLVGFFNKEEDIDTKRPYLHGDEGGSQKVSRDARKSRKEIFSDKIFEDRITDEKRDFIKEKGLLKNPNFKHGYEPIDLAHRLSLGTSKRFGIQQKTGTLGLDRPVVNQVFVEYYQSKLNKVYNQQRDLITNKPKDWRKKLEASNKLVTSIVNDADNRIVGVMIDEKTLKPKLFGDKLAAKYAIDGGLFDTEIKKLKPQDKDFIKKFLLQDQIMREVDTGLDVKNFRNINKDSITKWMNKKNRFKKNTELKKQALQILEDNPQITKSQGVLGTKDSQPQIKKILQDLLKLAGTKNKKCKGLLSYGGRVALQDGLSPEFCINEGRKVARDLIAKNREGTLAQKGIMRRVTSGIFNFAKSILDPKEFFNLKKQFLSKGALASIPIFDAVMAFDDASRKNMDPKEAFAKTLTFGTIPRAMGLTDSIDVINAKKMLEDPSLSPAGKEYAQAILDIGEYKKLSTSSIQTSPEMVDAVQKRLKELKNNIAGSQGGRFDYEKLLTEKEAKDKAGEYVGEPHKVGPGSYLAFDGEEVRKVNEYGYARKGTTFDAPDKPDVTPLVNKLAKKATSRGPMTEMKKQKIDYTPLTYENYKPFSFTKEEFEDTMRKVGALKEDQIYGDDYYQKTIETPMKASQKTEFMELPSFRGSAFSEGGITELRSKYEYKK